MNRNTHRTFGEQILSLIGESEIACPGPAPRSVSATISSRTAEKSENFFPGRWRNSAHSAPASPSLLALGSLAAAPREQRGGPAPVFTSCSSSGLRVQIPAPRGRKSLPTRASSTEDLPADWAPTTATWGRSTRRSREAWEGWRRAEG